MNDTCPDCLGSGREAPDERCDLCRGTGLFTPRSNTSMKRYDLGREHKGNTGVPAIVETPDGAYVRLEDHQRLLAACESHNEMYIAKAKRLQEKLDRQSERAAQIAENYPFSPCIGKGIASTIRSSARETP